MSIQSFLQQLFSDGQTSVDDQQEISENDQEAVQQIMVEFEVEYRLTFPGKAPQFDSETGYWALRRFYHASQLTVYRDWGEDLFPKLFSDPAPQVDPVTSHYSVDLIFRFLPDLVRFAQSSAPKDPLITELNQWALDWPLSSVGMKLEEEVSLDPIVNHTGMMRFYVDRVIEKQDQSRTKHPKVEEILVSSVGLQDSLKSKLQHLLPEEPKQPEPEESLPAD